MEETAHHPTQPIGAQEARYRLPLNARRLASPITPAPIHPGSLSHRLHMRTTCSAEVISELQAGPSSFDGGIPAQRVIPPPTECKGR